MSDYLSLNNKKSPRSKVSQYLWLRIPEFIDFYDEYAQRSSISLKKSITYLRYFVLFWGYFKVHLFHVYFEVVQSIILITSQNFALYQKICLRFFSQKIVSDAQGPKKPFLNIKQICQNCRFGRCLQRPCGGTGRVGLLNGRKNCVHSFSPSVCKVCGYAPSTSILVPHTFVCQRMI